MRWRYQELDKYSVAVVGAASLVGQEIVRILEERHFPLASLNLYAGDDTVGKIIYSGNRSYTVKTLNLDSFKDTDMAFFAAGDEAARHYVTTAVQAGVTVIDNSTIYRLIPDVPLIIPEINAEDIQRHRGIIASPGCSSILLNVALYPLHKTNPIKKVVVSTYQSTSGLGQPAMDELTVQTQQMLAGETPKPNVFPHEIGFNILPQVDVFLDNGYTKEEWQMLEETRKILHNSAILVAATCVRVPTLKGHCQAILIEFNDEINTEIATGILAKAPAIRVVDDTDINLYPHPRMAAGTDQVMVGRLRQDVFNLKGLALWVVADNIRKGGALNMVQIAEEINKKGWLKAKGQR
jgi:aspartate-semialdehyde dehydrogenase